MPNVRGDMLHQRRLLRTIHRGCHGKSQRSTIGNEHTSSDTRIALPKTKANAGPHGEHVCVHRGLEAFRAVKQSPFRMDATAMQL